MSESRFETPEERAAYCEFQLATLDGFGTHDGHDIYARDNSGELTDAAYEHAVTVLGLEPTNAIGLLLAAQLETEGSIRELALITPEDFHEQVEV